jgi:transcription elongation factor Elf1
LPPLFSSLTGLCLFICSFCSHAPNDSCSITLNVTIHNSTVNTLNSHTVNETVINSASTKVDSSNDSDDKGGDVREAKENSSVAAKIRSSSDKDRGDEDVGNRKPPAKTPQGMTLSFKAGPLKGQDFHMIKGKNETVIVGSNPIPKTNASVLKIADNTLGASHVKFHIQFHKKRWSLTATDLKPNKGVTKVNAYAIPAGKIQLVLPAQYIYFGQSTVLVLVYKGANTE